MTNNYQNWLKLNETAIGTVHCIVLKTFLDKNLFFSIVIHSVTFANQWLNTFCHYNVFQWENTQLSTRPSIYSHENTFVSIRMSLQTVLKYTQVDFRHIT